MHEDRIIAARLRKRVGHTALFVALAVVPVLGLNSLATADTSSDPTAAPRAAITDAQRQCLADQGVTLPTRSSNDDKPALTRDERHQVRQAGQACGLRGPGMKSPAKARGLAHKLTDEQRQCVADQGVSLPGRTAEGSAPSVSAEQRAALRQAAEVCGLPARGHHGGADGAI